ncbi:hypothetical protein ACIGO8_33070 [Streptomyces sp. NPDC053493]|uniref:hypothetical protein n=1 Tax=Streptomyces sp. NPDC053493 TaxID=3365705 RepID=UPI0037D8FA29
MSLSDYSFDEKSPVASSQAAGPYAASASTVVPSLRQTTSAPPAVRGRERLGLMRPLGEALVIQGLHWGDEIRSPAELAPPETDISEHEIEGALALMDTMSVEHLADLGDWLTDHYTEALVEVISAKAEHREPAPIAGEEPEAVPVVDLMAALEASVAKAKESRGETGGPATVHEMPKPKKTAAKKKTAKKTTAKKTAAKKPAHAASPREPLSLLGLQERGPARASTAGSRGRRRAAVDQNPLSCD